MVNSSNINLVLPTLGIGSVIVWIIAGVKANKDKENQYLEKGYVLKRDY